MRVVIYTDTRYDTKLPISIKNGEKYLIEKFNYRIVSLRFKINRTLSYLLPGSLRTKVFHFFWCIPLS